ncbi:hypothetical protein BTE77_31380 [Ensifer adhaerens]|nr:hypothetical protein BTE77_31380 [Ensifer adhaerens]
MMEFRNAFFSRPNEAAIDMEVNHPEFGWMPFTATAHSPDDYNRELFAAAKAGTVSPYVPPAPPTAEELAAARLAAIKDECRRRIYAVASAETQMNMTAATTLISAKPPEDRDTRDLSILTGQTAALAWVTAMRANVAILAAEPEADITLEAGWPACPPEVLAVVNLF